MTGALPAGYQIASTPTVYRGIKMRSRLEAKVAGALDAAAIPWEYEPFVLADGTDQWFPDFRIGTANRTRAYVEVRPTIELVQRDLQRYTRIAAASDPAALVIGLGFIDDDPLRAVTAEGRQVRLAPPVGSPTPALTQPMELLPVPAAIKRRASERARLDKVTRDMSVFRTSEGRGFTRVGSTGILPLLPDGYHDPSAADVLSDAYAAIYGRPPAKEKLTEHLEELTASCTVIIEVCSGIARLDDDRWLLDLGVDHGTNRVVTITPTGWRLSSKSPMPLYRRGVTALPLPVHGGHVDDLYDLLNVHEDDFDTLVDALAYCFLPGHRCQPTLASTGYPLRATGPALLGGGRDEMNPLGEVVALGRSRESDLFPRCFEKVLNGRGLIRFVDLHGNDRDIAIRSVETIRASYGRILGALLDRAVTILAGPRELEAPGTKTLGPPAADATDRMLELLMETFPGSTLEVNP